ncbi:choline transporter-like protein 4 [Oscarella lobularis]|uniref:choline transporter-like protein 4 n=1 Tax=Oscarella lobularis TaxID=121494 RepID=UPI00331375CF
MGCCFCPGSKDEDDDRGGDDGDSKEYGKPTPYDPKFKGPVQNRCCTDILMLLIFIAFWGGMFYIAIYGYMNGNPQRLLYPTDSEGNLCGTGELENRSKLLFFDISSCITSAATGFFSLVFTCPTPQVCVNRCPDSNALGTEVPNDGIYCVNNKKASSYESDSELLSAIADGQCAPYYIKSESILGRCVPTFVDFFGDVMTPKNKTITYTVNGKTKTLTNETLRSGTMGILDFLNLRRVGEEVYSDMGIVWPWLIGGLVIILLFSAILIVIMRWIAGFIVWLSIFAVLGLLSFGIAWCFIKYRELETEPQTPTTLLETFLYQKNTYLALGIICCIVLAILLLIVLCLRSRIQIAIELIKEGSRAIGNMWSTLFFPIITFILLCIVICWWATAAVFLQSSGNPIYGYSFPPSGSDDNGERTVNGTPYTNGKPCVPEEFNETKAAFPNETFGMDCVFEAFEISNTLLGMQVYNLFGLLWTSNYVLALGQCSLAGAFASYYWAPPPGGPKKNLPSLPLTRAFFRALVWHTGSLAFGALIIAIIQMIRLILGYTQKKLKGASDNEVARFFLKCLSCCFWCLEKIFRYINKNAYILVAIYGYHFCKACCRAFNLLMRNIVRVFVLTNITTFVFFLCRLLVIGLTCTVAFVLFDYLRTREDLNYYLIPVIILGLCAFFISWAFFSVYDMAIDTLFLCFLEDLERNDGSSEKPYYMSKGLKKVLGKKNKEDGKKKKKGNAMEVKDVDEK